MTDQAATLNADTATEKQAGIRPINMVGWGMQIAVAGAFIATGAIPKLTPNPASVALFDAVGPGDPARIMTGVAELLAAVLILVPRTSAVGGLMAMGVMAGALGAHLFTPLGVSISASVHPDLEGPTLFMMASVLMVLSAGVVAIRRRRLPIIGRKLFGK